ncbi:putative disease resistance protein RGA3 [Fagus crenata]
MASEIKEAESPPSQLNRADLRPAPSAANSNKLYLFFWHAYSPVMYTLYEIDVPRPLPPPPTKAAQDAEIKKPRPLLPILQLKTGEYPDGMSCVQLGSKLYFFGGEFDIDDQYIDEDVKKKLKNEKRDVFPRDVYIFDLDTHNISDKPLDKLLVHGTPMKSGKASPHAFAANEKIYVVGSSIEMDISDRSKMKDVNLESFYFFEVYDPESNKWDFLPNPPIGKVETKWVGHAVVGSKALLVASQLGNESLYCFDLRAKQWTKYAGLPSYPGNFSGRIEYVEDALYGCYHSTIAAIAPLAKEEEEEEVKVEEEEEEEEFKHHRLHGVSTERGMDAIFNVPPQLRSSFSLLHLGNRHFCYLRTGMPPDPINGSDYAVDDKRLYISIVIFRALKKTYKKESTRLFRAKFLHSAHYVVDTPFSNEGSLEGCFSPGWKYRTARHRPESSEGTSGKNLTPIEEAKSVDIETSMGISEELMDYQKLFHRRIEFPQMFAPIGQGYPVKMLTPKNFTDGRAKPSTSNLDDPSPPLSNAVQTSPADFKSETSKLDQAKTGIGASNANPTPEEILIGASNANPIPEDIFWAMFMKQEAHETKSTEDQELSGTESNAPPTKQARTDQTVTSSTKYAGGSHHNRSYTNDYDIMNTLVD